MSAADRMRRYRLRKRGKADGRPRACVACGATISIYAPMTDLLCAPCGNGKGQVCKRGHDLEATSRVATRGSRITIICAACKRDRDAGYARQRRAKETA